MPSDDRLGPAMEAVAAEREVFRSAMAVTIDELSGLLARRRGSHGEGAARRAAELGALGAGRIDAARFAQLFADEALGDPVDVGAVERALEVLTTLAARGEGLHRVKVPPGRPVAEAVGSALGEAGRAFGAAHVAQLARSGGFRAQEHETLLAGYPFERWSRAERRIAPPLVVEVQGGDLAAGGLAAFLDGSVKLVLLVEGPCPPAPLVRLLTPGVLVLQEEDASEFARLAGHAGPAVAALVPGGAACFVHDPASPAGEPRLRLRKLPEAAPTRRVGAISPFQQAEELALLAALGRAEALEAPPSPRPGDAAPAEGSPADRLAAWLLRQAGLEGTDAEMAADRAEAPGAGLAASAAEGTGARGR